MHNSGGLPEMLCDVEVNKNLWEDTENIAKEIRLDESDGKTITMASLHRLIETLTSVDDYGTQLCITTLWLTFC
jgi:Fe-S-cluster formation regulator IscX/YfhJ